MWALLLSLFLLLVVSAAIPPDLCRLLQVETNHGPELGCIAKDVLTTAGDIAWWMHWSDGMAACQLYGSTEAAYTKWCTFVTEDDADRFLAEINALAEELPDTALARVWRGKTRCYMVVAETGACAGSGGEPLLAFTVVPRGHRLQSGTMHWA